MARHSLVGLAVCLSVFLGCSQGGSSGSGGSSASSTQPPSSQPPSSQPPSTQPPSTQPPAPTPTPTPTPIPVVVLDSGSFSLLTYNVAGLPQGLSGSNPTVNIPQISPLLNSYDMVLVQEDFAYNTLLTQDAYHPYQSITSQPSTALGPDGLNRFADFSFSGFYREKWMFCFGTFSNANDCLSEKGFSFATHLIAPGVEIDVYNLHADAGGAPGDVQARTDQFAQLATYILAQSANRAILVAGDTNLGGFDPDDEPVLVDFMQVCGLTDSARHLGMQEKIDRVLFRSGDHVLLEAVFWRIADEFVDAAGNDLSDHNGIHVDIDWTLTN